MMHSNISSSRISLLFSWDFTSDSWRKSNLQAFEHLDVLRKGGLPWVWPPHSNSDHQEYHVFSGGSHATTGKGPPPRFTVKHPPQKISKNSVGHPTNFTKIIGSSQQFSQRGAPSKGTVFTVFRIERLIDSQQKILPKTRPIFCTGFLI